MKAVTTRILHDKVLWIAAVAAGLSLFVGRPQVHDINWTTIWSLLALMVCVQLLNGYHVLDQLSQQLLTHSHNQRQIVQYTVLLAFVGAMFLTNDVAILTLFPMYIRLAHQQHLPIAFPTTLIVLAANLGSAFTPFGNPQNLFLVAHYHIDGLAFLKLSTPLMLIGLFSLAGLTYGIAPRSTKAAPTRLFPQHPGKIALTTLLFGLTLLGIFQIFPLGWITVIVIISGWLLNRAAIKQVDYGLLLTFICFFILVSSFSHNAALTTLIAHVTRTPVASYLTGLTISQVISNVPATVLLANFTNHLTALYWGVNLGGLGTLVASLANLLALKQLLFLTNRPTVREFFKVFALVNLGLLVVLGTIGYYWIR